MKRMRRMLAVVLCVAMMLSVFTAFASAVSGSWGTTAEDFAPVGELEIDWDPDVASHITLDGNLSEWAANGYTSYEISPRNMVSWVGSVPDDWKMQCFFVADAERLYVAFNITDDKPCVGDNPAAYNGDAFQMGFDWGHNIGDALEEDEYYGWNAQDIFYSFSMMEHTNELKFTRQCSHRDGLVYDGNTEEAGEEYEEDWPEFTKDNEWVGMSGTAAKTATGWCAEFSVTWQRLASDAYYKLYDYDFFRTAQIGPGQDLEIGCSFYYLNRDEDKGGVTWAAGTMKGDVDDNGDPQVTWTTPDDGVTLVLKYQDGMTFDANSGIEVLAAEDPAPEWEPITTVGMMSPDTYYENGMILNDGNSGEWLKTHRPFGISGVDSASFRGWAGIGDKEIEAYGYSFDNDKNNIVWDADFVKPAEEHVKYVAGQYATRYIITVDLSAIPDTETHTLHLLVQATDGSIYELSLWNSAPIKVTRDRITEPETEPATEPETEPANAPASYSVVDPDSAVYVRISSSGSAKYYQFVPTLSGTYGFYSSDNSGDPKGALLDANGNVLISDDDSGSGSNFLITYDCTAGTTYYIKAYMYSGTGAYTLNIQTMELNCEHNYVLQDKTTVDCTHDGVETYVCLLCYDTYSRTIAEAPGHDYVNGVCSRCGAEEPQADVWDGTIDTSWYDAYTTEFTLYTAEQLAGLAQLVNNGNTFSGKTIYLGNNIDLAGIEWTPIGKGSTTDGDDYTTLAFSGTFNGNGHYISNLSINTTSLKRAGLFGALNGATITMLGVVNANVVITQQHIVSGAVIAGTANMSTIVKCDAEGTVSVTDTSTGGNHAALAGILVGRAYTMTINSSIASGSVSGCMPNDWNAYVGGIAGCIENRTSTITDTYFRGQIDAYGHNDGYAGGILGILENSASINNCFVVADITSSDYKDAIAAPWQNYLPVTSNSYYSSSTSSSLATSTSSTNFQSQSWIESNLGWDFTNTWEFRAGHDYPVLRGFGQGGHVIPHTHNYVETSRTDATCTTDGRIDYACSCGETRFDFIRATGHNMESVVEAQVTCTSDGLIVDRCTNPGCNYERRTVVHGEHNYAITDRREATCETQGYIEYTCSNCHDTYYEYFEGVHNYVEVSRVDPQVEVEGSITYSCTYCGDSYSIVLPALTPVLKSSSVLLIQDSIPWSEDVNLPLLETLKQRGVISSYNIINTSALASFDLSQYGVVLIANDQTSSMYNRLAANADKLEYYVRAGGNLIYGACDSGWAGGALNHTLPGGVTTSNYYSVHNYVVNEMHPIITGVYTDNRSIKDELLKGNYCSHAYFTNLPAGTDILIRDANGNPTLIEYTLGDGTVIASGLTWEYFYVRSHYNMATNYSKNAYDDLVTYMVYITDSCEHDYELDVTVEPTCEENGYTKYVCSLCGREYMGDVIVATGHTTGDWILDAEPTASQTGSRHKECTICHQVVETEVLPVLAKLVISQVESKAGLEVQVTIDIRNNPGVLGAILTLEYDPALTLVSAVKGNAWSSLAFTAPNLSANPGNLVWDGVNNADFSDGTIVTLTFRVPDDAEVGTVYDICASYGYENIINADLEHVELGIENGSVTVTTLIGDVNDDDVVDVADVIALRRFLVDGGNAVQINELAADINGDGVITVLDVVLLRRMLVG